MAGCVAGCVAVTSLGSLAVLFALACFLVACPCLVLGQVEVVWEKIIQCDGIPHPWDMICTNDGGFVVVGSLEYRSGSSFIPNRIYLLKVDGDGDKEWEGVYGQLGNDRAWGVDVVERADGSFLVVGTARSLALGDKDIYLAAIDSEGRVVWEDYFGGEGDQSAAGLVTNPDGGCLLVGATSVGDDVCLLKVGPDGEKIWEKTLGVSREYHDYKAMRVSETDESGLVIVGTSRATGPVSIMMFLIRIDGEGNKVWETHAAGSPWMIVQSGEDGYFVAFEWEHHVYRFNESGYKEWMKVYSGEVDCVRPVSGGGFLISGSVMRSLTGYDAWLALVDGDGGVVWDHVFESPENMGALCMASATSATSGNGDGGYGYGCVLAIVGMAEDFTRKNYTLTRVRISLSESAFLGLALLLLIIVLGRWQRPRSKRPTDRDSDPVD